MKKRKILIYSNMSPSAEVKYGGVFVSNQYNFLRTYDTENEYYLFSLKKTFTGVVGSIFKYVSFVLRSFIYIRKQKFDVIHLHFFFPLAFVPWIFKAVYGTKIIVTVHGSDLYKKMNNPITRKLFAYLLKNYDYVISVGNQLGEDLYRVMGIKSNSILCAGVNTEIFMPKYHTKRFDFVFVGNLIEGKGLETLLKVVDSTADTGYKWCVVGAGPYKPQVEALAKCHPDSCIYFSGLDQIQLNDIFNESKWLFFPSHSESFGLVVSEAIFAGTPVICSYIGGLKEQIEDNINGYAITNPEDVDECLELLKKAYNLTQVNYNKFVDNCKHSNDQFALKTICEKLRQIYTGV